MAASVCANEPSAEDAEFFEKEIRPLLIDRCYQCHGDLQEPKGGLALTSRAAVLKGGETGPAAVEGQPGQSRLIAAIKYDGLEMPPEGKKLPEAEVASLTRWVERGMPWPKDDPERIKSAKRAVESKHIAEVQDSFWSFRPVRQPPLPAVADSGWPQTTIDRFILASLEKRNLKPSPPADKRTLLRRLSFDLLGLPPTPEEIDAWMRDDSPGAVERVVDRLLASPHYGERWGRYWLDVARYADTRGYVFTEDGNFPWSYTYRDYVVRSLNEDLPYDQFVVEQLAADQLALGADKRPLTALGFLTLGSKFMNNQQDIIDDRIDVVTRGLLGLTVSCARCHDHKFDPIPTADYYSLYGVFASCVEPTIPPLFEDPPQTQAYADFAKELAERERKLAEFLDQKFRELVDGARTRAAEYLLAAHALRGKPALENFMLLADGKDLNPTMTLRYQTFLQRSQAGWDPVFAIWHALDALPEKDFAVQAPQVVAQLIAARVPEKPIHPLVVGAFLGKPLKDMGEAARIYGELLSGADQLWRAELEKASAAKQPAPTALADPNLESLRLVFYGPETPPVVERSTVNDLALLPDRPAQKIHTDLLKAIETHRTSAAAPPRAMVLEDLASPVHPRVFLRGSPSQLGDEVPRRFLRVLSQGEPASFAHGSGRLDLARSIVDRQNPLTARVLVNRVWQNHFGTGLVHTASDFGLRSEPPTHPELLDALAWDFMEQGWSLKKLHRRIVLSAVYQQAAFDRPDCQKVDPENTLLWRMNRRRLDFEATRDALLAVAGRLDQKIGGPGIKDLADPAGTRRTLYGSIDRLNLPGLFRTFDFPSPDATSPGRSLTTVPQQALFFMNNPLVLQSARSLLARTEVASETDLAKKIGRVYQLALGREPAADEIELAGRFLQDAQTRPAAWDEFAQGLLLTNEFLFVD